MSSFEGFSWEVIFFVAVGASPQARPESPKDVVGCTCGAPQPSARMDFFAPIRRGTGAPQVRPLEILGAP